MSSSIRAQTSGAAARATISPLDARHRESYLAQTWQKSLARRHGRRAYCREQMIDRVAGFVQHNLIVLLAVVLVPMKFVILRLCGDWEAQKVALLSVPEDLVYVSLGLLLGDFATSGGAFRRHFEGSAHILMDLFVTVLYGLAVAIIVHLLAKWTGDRVLSSRAAAEARVKNQAAGEENDLSPRPKDDDFRLIQVRHITIMSMLYLAQLVATIWWLAWIASVLAADLPKKA